MVDGKHGSLDRTWRDNRQSEDKRPSPDALLEHAQRETQGRLKIFLGAAPGVGKTYEMLQSAPAPSSRKTSTSWSAWSRPMAGGDRRPCSRASRSCRGGEIAYKGQISRRSISTPSSRGAPRSRWSMNSPIPMRRGAAIPKRYLDVEELLAEGIDVYTTVNIQHVESLNDIVAQITRVRVRETVPDSFSIAPTTSSLSISRPTI